jgi:ABC-2 type transport system permease protein
VTVLSKNLRDNRRLYLGWAIAIAAIGAMYSAFWPTFGHNENLTKAVDAFPQSMRDAFHMQDYASAPGYFGSTVFGLLVPILMAVFAISIGVKALATDEQAGTLDLVLAHPVGRVRLALARYGAIVLAVALAAAVLLAAVLALRVPAKFTELSPGNIAAIGLQLALFGICFASIAFGVGAYTGKRVYALGIGAYVAVAGYLADSFLPQIKGLGWISDYSPFGWYLDGEPLRNGVQWGHCALLLGVGLFFAAVGVWGFHRRDIAV